MFEWMIENTLIAAGLALVVLLVERRASARPAVLHVLWVACLCVLVMPRLPLSGLPGQALRAELTELLWARDGGRADAPLDEVATWSPTRTTSVDPLTVGVFQGEEELALAPFASTLRTDGVQGEERVLPSLTLEGWLLLGWGLGAFIIVLRAALRIRAFGRVLRSSTGAPAAFEREVRRVAGQVGVRVPEVRLLRGIASPSVWCFGTPRLIWPADDDVSRPASSRATLLAHELAHLARKDHWVSWLEVPAAALFWWNPLFWLIRGRIRHLAELSCDAWAVWAYPADRRAFAEALIDMQARTVCAPVAPGGLGATDSEFKDFERRLHMIMQKRVSRSVSKGAVAAAFVGAVLVSPGFSDGIVVGGATPAETAKSRAPIEVAVEGKRLHAKAEKLYQAKDHAAALEVFAQAVALDPENGPGHARLGLLLIGAGELEAAEEHFLRQYELGHSQPNALYNVACAKSLAGDPWGAVEYVAAAARHGFTNAELLESDSDLETAREAPELAKKMAKLTKLVRSAKELKHELAMLEQAGDKAGFLGAHGELAKLLSADGALQSEHGHLALSAGDYEGAAIAFGRQAKIGHNAPNAYYNRACALALDGDAEAAFEDLVRAADEGMTYVGVLEDSDLDSLRSDARFDALAARIAKPALESKKLKAKLEAGDYEAALAGLDRIRSDESRSAKLRAWALMTTGRTLLDQGKSVEALDALQEAASFGVGVEEAAFLMARAYANLGETKSALRHVEHAVDLGYADGAAIGDLLESGELCSPATAKEMVERASLGSLKKSKKGAYKSKSKAWAAGLETSKSYGWKKAVAKGA